MKFCAICTTEIVGDPVRAPLGKDDAMVDICAPCDGDKPVATRGREVDYDLEERGSWLEFRHRIDHFGATHKVAKVEPYTVVTKKLTPGWILVRVSAIATDGGRRDMVEAFDQLAHEPWADDIAWLGSVGRWMLFERPDPDVPLLERRPSRNKTQADVRAYL